MRSIESNRPSAPPRSRVLGTLRALIRTRITAGLLTVLPIVVTIWLVRVIFGWLRDASIWVVNYFLLSSWGRELLAEWGVPEQALLERGLAALPLRLQWGVSIFSVLLTFFLLYLIGLFGANVIGRRMIYWLEQIVERLPFVKTIYRTLKQVLGLFGPEKKPGFQRVALVPFPNELTRSIAFITNTFRDSLSGEELCTCFIASTPNPTTGFVFVVRRKDVIEVDWPVEDAVKAVMSGGILTPPYVTMLTESARLAAGLAAAPASQQRPTA